MARRSAFPRQFVLRMLPPGSVGAEIGVWQGDFAAKLLEASRPRRLHLIDPWRFIDAEPYRKAWYGGAKATNQAEMDQIHRDVLRRFRWARLRRLVKVHRATSVEAASRFPNEYFDWVYIDGDHTYEAVRADIAAYRDKVKRGGMIVGDDYRDEDVWGRGVKRAFDEAIASGALELVKVRRNQVVCRIP